MGGRWRGASTLALIASLALPALVVAGTIEESPGLRLIDPGSEPRTELRYDWREGLMQRMRLEMIIEAETIFEGRTLMELTIPASMALTLRVEAVDAEGAAEVAWQVDGLDIADLDAHIQGEPVDPGDLATIADQMGADVGELMSIDGRFMVESDGRVLEDSMEASELLPGELLVAIEEAVLRVEQLPDVPIGPGARWETTSTSRSPGASYAVSTVSEITQLAPGRVVLEQVITGALDDETPAGRRGGASTTLRGFKAEGSGTSTVDLAGIVAEGSSTTRVRMRLEVDDGDPATDVTYATVTRLNVDAVE